MVKFIDKIKAYNTLVIFQIASIQTDCDNLESILRCYDAKVLKIIESTDTLYVMLDI